MRKYVVGLVAMATLSVYGTTTLAQSSVRPITARPSATTVTLTVTTREVLLSNTCTGFFRNIRKPPCETVFLGVQKNAQGDRQLAYATDIFTGHRSNVYTYHATNDAYDALGTITSTYTGTTTFRRDGTQIDRGHGHIIAGTGAYRGITGTLSFTGRNSTTAKVFVFKSRATVTLP